jgi:predicted amidophosphoribosyltransferase
MTDTSPYCSACERPLGPDDLFCSKCGRPTPLNLDPDATVRVDEASENSSPLDAGPHPGRHR